MLTMSMQLTKFDKIRYDKINLFIGDSYQAMPVLQ